MKALELVIRVRQEPHIGATYAFSAVASQLAENLSSLPFDYLLITDVSLPTLRLACTPSSRRLIIHPNHGMGSSDIAFTHVSKWLYLCPMQLTQLSLTRVAVSNESMRGLFQIIPTIQSMSFTECLVDLCANAGPALAWAFLWNRAIAAGQHLESAHVEACGYGRRDDGCNSPLTPINYNVGLQLMLKEDALAFEKLEKRLAGQAAQRRLEESRVILPQYALPVFAKPSRVSY
jgi:hypothetical protein